MDDLKVNVIDDETISAISAAISMMCQGYGCRLVVKNIKRVPQTAPVWNATGRIERLRNDMNS